MKNGVIGSAMIIMASTCFFFCMYNKYFCWFDYAYCCSYLMLFLRACCWLAFMFVNWLLQSIETMLMQVGQVLKMEIEEGKGFSCKACHVVSNQFLNYPNTYLAMLCINNSFWKSCLACLPPNYASIITKMFFFLAKYKMIFSPISFCQENLEWKR